MASLAGNRFARLRIHLLCDYPDRPRWPKPAEDVDHGRGLAGDALYAGPLALWAYFRIGRLSSRKTGSEAKENGRHEPAREKPFWQSVAVVATHCGAGCSLGDLVFWFVMQLAMLAGSG